MPILIHVCNVAILVRTVLYAWYGIPSTRSTLVHFNYEIAFGIQ